MFLQVIDTGSQAGNSYALAADVTIMNIQLAMQHGKEDKVRKQMEYKVNRQLGRIDRGNDQLGLLGQ
ncbi:MAG TPA: hypothetical protein IAA26_12860 [Candidatus Blautia faecipullorum]|nr:hypothetical protein [Candidatus Blautia faecipullorum]